MRLVFTTNGWEDFTHWLHADRQVLKRINRLIDDSLRQSTLSLTPEHRLHAGCPSMRPGSTPSWPRTLLLLFAHVR